MKCILVSQQKKYLNTLPTYLEDFPKLAVGVRLGCSRDLLLSSPSSPLMQHLKGRELYFWGYLNYPDHSLAKY